MDDYSKFFAEVKPYSEHSEWNGHPVTLLNPTDGCSNDVHTYNPLVIPLGLHPNGASRVNLHYHKYNAYIGPLAGLESECAATMTRWPVERATPALERVWAEAGNVTRWRP